MFSHKTSQLYEVFVLEWVAIPFSRGSSQHRDWTWVSCIAGRFFTVWAIREVPYIHVYLCITYRWASLGGSDGKESTCNMGEEEGMETHSSILVWRIPMNRGAWQATDNTVAKSDTTEQLSRTHTYNLTVSQWREIFFFQNNFF